MMRNLDFALGALLAIAVGGCSATPAPAAGPVSTDAALAAALANAKGGETIAVAPGDYTLSLDGKSYAKPVTITSAVPDKLAHFSDISLSNVENVTLRNVRLGRVLAAGEQNWLRFVRISGSRNILVDQAWVHGSLDDNPLNDGVGIFVIDTNGITISRSDFQQLYNGVIFTKSQDVTLQGNRFYQMASDGSDFSAIDTALIDGNCYSSFHPAPGDHPDGIQFWNHSVPSGSTNVKITNNQVFKGTGDGMQGIFISAENPELRHSNFTVANNLVYNQNLYHGIFASGVDHVLIENNTVLSIPGGNPVWIAAAGAADVTLTGNVADQFVNDKSRDVKLSDNIFLNESGGKVKFPNRKAGAEARASDLIIAGRGFQGADKQCVISRPAE